MQNLELVSARTNEHLRKVVDGNTINFNFERKEDGSIITISVNVCKGLVGEPTYTGNALATGTFFAEMDRLSFDNFSLTEIGPNVYQEVVEACLFIANPVQEE